MRGVVAVLGLVLLGGCVTEAFVCLGDPQCDGGVCEASGYCSYPDTDCASGRRYGVHAGEGLGGVCVAPEDGSTSTTSQPSTSSGSDTSSTGTGEATTDSTTSTTTSSPSTSGSTAGWFDEAWLVRQALQIDGSDLVDTLFDVPIAVRIDASRTDVSSIASGGLDLRFVAADQLTVYEHEIDAWQDGETSWVWVQVPEILAGTDTIVWMYYGNPEADDATTPGAVWSNGYRGVWHLGVDATDALDGAEADVESATVDAGQIGSGARFGGAGASIAISPLARLADLPAEGMTLSAWVLPDSLGEGSSGRILDKSDGIVPALGFSWQMSGVDQRRTLQFDRGGMSEGSWVVMGDPITFGQWHHVAVTYVDPGPPAFYVDGQSVDAFEDFTWTPPAASDADIPALLGNGGVANREFDGVLDEVRVAGGIRSDAWIRLQFRSGLDDLVTFGPVETRP